MTGTSPMANVVKKHSISLELAQKMVDEAVAKAREIGMPPTLTLDQVKGFALFTIKAVLSGRGDELIDLATTNLFR